MCIIGALFSFSLHQSLSPRRLILLFRLNLNLTLKLKKMGSLRFLLNFLIQFHQLKKIDERVLFSPLF